MSDSAKPRRADKKISGVRELVSGTIRFIKEHNRALGSMLGVYILVDLFLGNGLSTISDAANNFNASGDRWHGLGNLIGVGANSGGTSTSALPGFLGVIMLMVYILLIKQLRAGKWLGVKETFYRSMYPLVPFLLVAAALILQLLPMALGSVILVAVVGGTPSTLAAIVFGGIFLLLSAWSIYMLAGSIFALFFVAESGAQPMTSLRKSRKLADGRRWLVVSRLLPLPIVIFIVYLLVLLPLALIFKTLIPIVFYLLGASVLPAAAVYTYLFYEELADER